MRLWQFFDAMAQRIYFIIGTDTGVGKTVFTALLTRRLREKEVRVAALKPLCSGGRVDARVLRAASGHVLSLDEINPWHFRAPLAPLLAARLEKKSVKLREVISHIQQVSQRFETVVVEGAGGLRSPLGENFDAQDCLLALRATPILICPNRLGAINQVLLVLNSLPKSVAKKLQIVLVSPRFPNTASRSNLKLLAEFIEPSHLHVLPWICETKKLRLDQRIRKKLDKIIVAVTGARASAGTRP